MMCRCGFINCNKYTTLEEMRIIQEAMRSWGQDVYGASLYLPLNLSVDKTALKIKRTSSAEEVSEYEQAKQLGSFNIRTETQVEGALWSVPLASCDQSWAGIWLMQCPSQAVIALAITELWFVSQYSVSYGY